MDRFRLGGIKLSEELVQLEINSPSFPDDDIVQLLQAISSAQVNIPHLHQGVADGVAQTSLCLSRKDYLRLLPTLESRIKDGTVRIIDSVGTFALFPHGNSLELFSKVVASLSDQSIPILGISSSVSALVIHTDFALLERAILCVMEFAELPENHTPLRPVVVLDGEEIETIAVYWEEKIRVYGIDIRQNLSFITLECPRSSLTGEALVKVTGPGGKFRLIGMFGSTAERVCLQILVEESEADGLQAMVDTIPRATVRVETEVGMISFHGPHFQDRYGIAEMTCSTLLKGGISLNASNCTGTSVHLLTAATDRERVSDLVAQNFVVPSTGTK